VSSRPQRAIALLLLLTYGPACSAWHVEEATPEQLFTREHPSRLRVTRLDRTQVELTRPELEGDSVVGFVRGSAAGVPFSDVRNVATWHTDTWKTGLLVFGIGAAVVATIVVVAAASIPND
jgi:hypothetical protein